MANGDSNLFIIDHRHWVSHWPNGPTESLYVQPATLDSNSSKVR